MQTLFYNSQIWQYLSFLCVLLVSQILFGQETYLEYEGKVSDVKSGKALEFATLRISNSNISTVTNSKGDFRLKIPQELATENLNVQYLGYQHFTIAISELKKSGNRIRLQMHITELAEVGVSFPKSAKELMRTALNRRSENYSNSQVLMTAFYRETIKKRRRNASLSEAVVKIYKESYNNTLRDKAQLIKARKSTDYSRLDTIALKLQGGPFNNLYTDIVKYPEYMFTNDELDLYSWSFGNSTRIRDNEVYVIHFKQLPSIAEPLLYGKLFVESKNKAIVGAIFHLNLKNPKRAARLFVKKKPSKAEVLPTKASYRVDYVEKNGKWHFSYANISLSFKIKWERRLFNSLYHLRSEIAITDWKKPHEKVRLRANEKMKPTIIIEEAASGFSDKEFWGAYNLIEPEKSINNAIKKINKQLRKLERK